METVTKLSDAKYLGYIITNLLSMETVTKLSDAKYLGYIITNLLSMETVTKLSDAKYLGYIITNLLSMETVTKLSDAKYLGYIITNLLSMETVTKLSDAKYLGYIITNRQCSTCCYALIVVPHSIRDRTTFMSIFCSELYVVRNHIKYLMSYKIRQFRLYNAVTELEDDVNIETV